MQNLMHIMNISIAVNDRYIKYACVMLTSLFENHKDRTIHVYVLYSSLSEQSIQILNHLGNQYNQKIFAMKIDAGKFPEHLPHNNEWTMEVYYRLALADILPTEISRVLYLDVDTIIIGPIWDLYASDFAGKSLCACPDMSAADGLPDKQHQLFQDFINRPDFQYFNSGVLLMNLEKIRQHYSLERFLDIATTLPLVSPDQDLLNYLFCGDVIYKNELEFNLFAKLAYCKGHNYQWVKEHTLVIHYAGRKPWSYEALHYNIERFWWDYAKKTPFYTEFLEDIVLNEVDSCYMDLLVRDMESKNKALSSVLGKCYKIIEKL